MVGAANEGSAELLSHMGEYVSVHRLMNVLGMLVNERPKLRGLSGRVCKNLQNHVACKSPVSQGVREGISMGIFWNAGPIGYVPKACVAGHS